MKAFTLIELLVVLGIVALGWLWLPILLSSGNASVPSRFDDLLAQLHARARMEALARAQPVSFAINANNDRMAVGSLQNGVFTFIAQTSIPPSAAFQPADSSDNGHPNHFTLANDEAGGFWRIWAYNADTKPAQSGGVMAFLTNGSETKWLIQDEGALVKIAP